MFSFYPQIEYFLAASQLVLAMAGMGATLTLHQFRAILLRPHPVILVLVLQYVLFPAAAALVARLAGLPPGIAVGLVLINSVPSGSFTNVFTYLGRGHVTLEVRDAARDAPRALPVPQLTSTALQAAATAACSAEPAPYRSAAAFSVAVRAAA